MKLFKKIGIPIISVLGVIALWQILSFTLNSEIVAPSVKKIFIEFIGLFSTKNFFKSIFLTLWRAVLSFLISLVLATVCAIFANMSETVERLFYPITVILRAMPTMSVILLCLIWLKSSKSPIAISFIVVFPMIYSAVLSALKSQDEQLLQMAKVYGVKRGTVLTKLILPQVLLSLTPQLISTFSFNIKLTVAGEALAYTKLSLGVIMHGAQTAFETARLLALTVVAIGLSFCLEIILKGIFNLSKRIIYGYNRKRAIQKIR